MRTVGAFEAKTHLSALLDAVEEGETVIIRRHGKPVAQLAPVRPAANAEAWRRIGAELSKLRARVKPGPPSIREMIESGRRY